MAKAVTLHTATLSYHFLPSLSPFLLDVKYRGRFQFTVGVAKTANSQYWTSLCFKVFDIPSMTSEGFEERMEKLKELSSSWDSRCARVQAAVKQLTLQV